MNIPNNLAYTKDHEWVKIENNILTVGITDFAQNELGDIVYIDIETISQFLRKGDIFGSVEAVKTVSDLFIPVSGTVIEVNQEIIDAPELINTDPYEKGWMIKIEITETEELSELITADAYKELIGV